LIDKVIRIIGTEKEVPSVNELKVKICSAHYMFNTIMNNGGQILIFDMRSMYNYLRGHVDYNFHQDSNIPLPCDYLLENDLSLHNLYEWLPTILEDDPKLERFNVINATKLKEFKQIRRKYVFIIAAQVKSIDQFKIEKIFRPRYAEGAISANSKDRLQDLMALRNAILLIDTLKKNNCYRNVFLLRDSQR